MTKTHLSVWLLPRSRRRDMQGYVPRSERAGAFVLASCGDEDFALVADVAGNTNRRIWPHGAPVQPRVLAR